MPGREEVLLIGGRAGVGKTSVAAELHVQLCDSRIEHALIEGDNLDQAWPVPHENGLALAEANLTAMWGNYRNAGYTRLVYTNTAAVRADVIQTLVVAIGGGPAVTGVLLTADDRTVNERLGQREIGGAFDAHVARSRRAAMELEELAPAWVHRISTDDRTVSDIANELRRRLDWIARPEDPVAAQEH